MDHRKRSPDASWTSVLLQTGPEGRSRLELELDWPLAWLGRPCWPPKVVAKEEDVLGHILGVLHLLEACSNLGLGSKCE
jgi:hypothetical protein